MSNTQTIAFTGSQVISTDDTFYIYETLRLMLENENNISSFITGACIGVDAIIAHMVPTVLSKYNIKNIIVVPANKKKVFDGYQDVADHIIEMPESSSYRDRNEMMVKHADRVIAFWTGKQRYSGTFMTMNIAKRAGKLAMEDIHMIGDVRNHDASEYYSL